MIDARLFKVIRVAMADLSAVYRKSKCPFKLKMEVTYDSVIIGWKSRDFGVERQISSITLQENVNRMEAFLLEVTLDLWNDLGKRYLGFEF